MPSLHTQQSVSLSSHRPRRYRSPTALSKCLSIVTFLSEYGSSHTAFPGGGNKMFNVLFISCALPQPVLLSFITLQHIMFPPATLHPFASSKALLMASPSWSVVRMYGPYLECS